jgi:prophage antirepressor-like protein
METALQVFNFKGNQVRTVMKDGEPWFILRDVCEVLGLSNPSMVVEKLSGDERADLSITDTSSKGVTQNRCMMAVNESGLYLVVFQSRKPEADAFRHWIAREVLPSIRKHGVYATDDFLAEPRKWAAAFIALAEEREAKAKLQAENKTLQVISDKYEGHTNTNGLYKIGEIAEKVGVSAVKLNTFLNDIHVQYKPNGSGTWRLYTEYLDGNYATPRIVHLDNGYDKQVLLWTAKGHDFIMDLVEKHQPEWYV